MTVTVKQITLFEQGWNAFYVGLGLYAIDNEMYQAGWLAAWEFALEEHQREGAVRRDPL